MSFLNTIEAKIRKFLNAQRDVVAELEMAIDKKEDSIFNYTKNLIELQTKIRETEGTISRLEREKAAQYIQLDLALEKDNTGDSEDLMRSIMEIDKTIEDLTTMLDSMKASRDTIQKSVKELTRYINRMKSKHSLIKIQLDAAKTQNDLMNTFTGMSKDAADPQKLMNEIKDMIKSYEYESQALVDLKEMGVLKSIDIVSEVSDEEAKAALERYQTTKEQL